MKTNQLFDNCQECQGASMLRCPAPYPCLLPIQVLPLITYPGILLVFITVPPLLVLCPKESVLVIEFAYAIGAIQMLSGFPCIVRAVVSSPSDKILCSSIACPFLEDAFHFVRFIHSYRSLFRLLIACG
jgi:hypothetical protein